MSKFGILATVVAKAGKEQEVAAFLQSALPLAQAEPDTVTWYSFQINETTFGIFDTFEHEEGRTAHLEGAIAKALMEKAPELLAESPVINKIDLLAFK